MLQLMDHHISSGVCTSQNDFCSKIGLDPSAMWRIKNGSRGFTNEQIFEACKRFHVNPSWIYGFSTEMSIGKEKTALQRLREAVKAVEAELKI